MPTLRNNSNTGTPKLSESFAMAMLRIMSAEPMSNMYSMPITIGNIGDSVEISTPFFVRMVFWKDCEARY